MQVIEIKTVQFSMPDVELMPANPAKAHNGAVFGGCASSAVYPVKGIGHTRT